MEKSTIFEPIKRVSLKQELAENILVKIFQGTLVGGDRLIERDLAAQLGVSRTPIREALAELVAIGMLQDKPNRGVVVRPFTRRRLEEIYDVRQILESQATRMACGLVAPEILRRFRDEIQALQRVSRRGAEWSRKALIVDQKLHQVISDNCGNQRLAEEIARYRNLVQAIRLAARRRASAQARAMELHLAIVEAMLSRNASLAASKMEEHIAQAAQDALEAVAAE